jgi:hypothetical protein
MGKIPVVCVADHRKMVEMFQRDGEAYATRPEGFKIPSVFIAPENGEHLLCQENKDYGSFKLGPLVKPIYFY